MKTPTVLKAPCAKCPFRSDVPIYLRAGRREDIARSLHRGEHFTCHEHTGPECDRHGPECVGARKAIALDGGSTQMGRIEERLGMVDLDELAERGADVWPLSTWPLVPEGETAATWDLDDAEDVEPCTTSNPGCLAPAGWLEGGSVVRGTTSADGECPTCGEPVCSECADGNGRCESCSDEWGDEEP